MKKYLHSLAIVTFLLLGLFVTASDVNALGHSGGEYYCYYDCGGGAEQPDSKQISASPSAMMQKSPPIKSQQKSDIKSQTKPENQISEFILKIIRFLSLG